MNICFICSKSENKVTHVLGNNSDCENEILNKLRSVVPEVVSLYLNPIWRKWLFLLGNVIEFPIPLHLT